MSLKRHITNILVYDDLHRKGKDLSEYEPNYSYILCYPKTQAHDHNTIFGRFWVWLQESWLPAENYNSLTETYYRHFELNYKHLQKNTENIHALVEAFKSLGNLYLTIRYRKVPSDTIRNVSYYIAATYNTTNRFAAESLPMQKLRLIKEGKKPKDLEKTE